MGPDVDGLATGDAVAVMVGWGCGSCRSCVTGHEQICPRGDEAGSTMDGGFAEYVLVPHRRHLVPLGTLSPVEAAPLGDAALSAYAATRRVMPHLVGGSTIVVIGIGGLGQYGVQFARALTAAIVVAVDTRHERLPLAIELGADHAVLAGESSTQEITDLVGPDGADAVVDFVGSDASLQLAAGIVGRRGVVALLGLAGGHCSFGFEALAPEASLTTVYAGSVGDLHDVVALARLGRLTTRVSTHPLRDINQVLDDLRAGRVAGRAVLVP
jgi:propanol-preferring alcohol dehydrogenase